MEQFEGFEKLKKMKKWNGMELEKWVNIYLPNYNLNVRTIQNWTLF